MTQYELVRAVAGATGESLRTIRGRGFSMLPEPSPRPEPNDLVLAVMCPFCGRASALPKGPRSAPSLAECARCDVEFDYPPADVFVTHAHPRGVLVATA
jgi:hypothetical protein